MPLKPQEVQLKTVHLDQEPLRKFPEIKTQIGSCDEYFVIEKQDLVTIKVDFLSRFHLITKTAEITTMSMEQRDLITGFLRSSGYPLEREAS
jgi:hypothetical protein